MKRSWLIGVVVVLILVLVGVIVKTKFFGRPGMAALSVSTTPKATVFIDGVQAGSTPLLNDQIEAGEHLVKLVPEATLDGLVSWEARVNLSPNVLTIINRSLGPSEAESGGETIWLEKIASKDKSSLAVVSIPDQAVVKIDGEPKGFAPVLLEDLTPGSYQVVVASPGYEERSVSVKTVVGFKLIINVQLIRQIEGIEEATPSAETTEEEEAEEEEPTPTPTKKPEAKVTPPPKPYVVIKETPTGWLRVREKPSTDSEELGRVEPDEMYPYLEEEENGWYKIDYDGEEGWISGVYADLVQ